MILLQTQANESKEDLREKPNQIIANKCRTNIEASHRQRMKSRKDKDY